MKIYEWICGILPVPEKAPENPLQEEYNEYLLGQFAPDTAAWLYSSSNALSKRKIPSPEDTGINGEFLGI